MMKTLLLSGTAEKVETAKLPQDHESDCQVAGQRAQIGLPVAGWTMNDWYMIRDSCCLSFFNGPLAQLVQSAWFTTRRS